MRWGIMAPSSSMSIRSTPTNGPRGFQSVAGFSHGGERMGSIEMAVLNVVHAKGEYWELWRGDGINPQTTAAIGGAWQEASKLGYDAYKEKLIAEGRYQEQNRGHRGRGGRG